jgi:hypothetical protein
VDALLELFSEIIGSLYDAIYQKKHTGKEIPWGRWLRLLGVGFSVVGIIIFILFIVDKDNDPSGAIVCAGPFIVIGGAFLVMAIIRKNKP